MMRASHKIGIGICALFAAACEREATGQVAAVVNGEEVTLQEINAELANSSVPAEADKEAIQKAALQRIVDRRLLAQAAREDGLDQDPEFLLRRRQLEDALLVQLLGKKLDRTTAVPSDRAIDTYIKEQPALFADRTIFAIDRIQFPMPADPDRLAVLENDHTIDAIAARLNSMGIQFQRQPAELDSAQLGQQRTNQLSALAQGEPFILPERGIVTVGIVTGTRKVPVNGQESRPLAVRAIRNQNMADALRERLEAARSKAEIKYQSSFTPAAAAMVKAANSAPR